MKHRVPSVPLSSNKHLLRWVKKISQLCKPDAIHWIDGSQREYDLLCEQMVASGSFIKLNQKKWPGCFLARSDASDVARVEDRTFICALSKEAAGPTNNWVNPFEMRKQLKSLFKGCMKGRTMYVLPYSMGPLGSPMSQIGVQLTDSPYAVVNMRIMARIGKKVFELIDHDFKRVVPCIHSVGSPGLATGRNTSSISPRRGRSGALARATAATRCWARNASPSASPPRWPATRAGWPSTC